MRLTLALIAAGLSLAAALPAAAKELPLLEAVRTKDAAAVQLLLQAGADPNARFIDDASVLSWAVEHHDLDSARALLTAGAKPDLPDAGGATPLLLACTVANMDLVGLLLDAKAAVTTLRYDKVSVLQVCAEHAPAAVLSRMIAAGAAVDESDLNGQTPLMWASAGGNLEAMALLIKHGADVNKATPKGFAPLFFAIKSAEPKAYEMILAAGGDPKHVARDGSNAVHLAIFEKKYDVAKALISKGADIATPDQNGNLPLHAAALVNNADFARFLIANGANIDAMNSPTRINWKTEPNVGDRPVAKFVGMTPLLLATQAASLDVMKVLVEAGAKTSIVAEDGTGLLLAGAASGNTAVLDYAVSLAPDLTVRNELGLSAVNVVLASRRRDLLGRLSPQSADMLRLLAARGAPMTWSDYRGKTPRELAEQSESEIAPVYLELLKEQEAKTRVARVSAAQ